MVCTEKLDGTTRSNLKCLECLSVLKIKMFDCIEVANKSCFHWLR